MIVAAHDDTISLSGLLVGPQRFTFKFMLETMADLSKRGTAIERITRGGVSGLTLVTSMTIRTDMQIQSLDVHRIRAPARRARGGDEPGARAAPRRSRQGPRRRPAGRGSAGGFCEVTQ